MRDDVSAIFVAADGPYPELVRDWWDVGRDATRYSGPNPVIAHPPCKRWGRWWWADGSESPGNDGGLFASAIESVRRWGGVLEHPASTHAWAAYDLPRPTRGGGWVRDIGGGWSCEVCQCRYGHRAQKRTWLYLHGHPNPPTLDWRQDGHTAYLCPPGRTKTSPGRTDVDIISERERWATPTPFAHLLIDLASACRARPA